MITPADRDLTNDMAKFYADPLGWVMYAFPGAVLACWRNIKVRILGRRTFSPNWVRK